MDWRNTLAAWFKAGYGEAMPCGVDERTLAPALLKSLYGRGAGKTVVAVVPMLALSERLASELRAWLGAAGLPELDVETLPEGSAAGAFVSGEEERARTLHRLLSKPPSLLMASTLAAVAPAPSPDDMRKRELLLRRGLELPLSKLVESLVDMDYDDEPEVSVPGEFARRGGIVDVFSPAHKHPVRIEFFGDVIDSLREFSPETQLSSGELTECRIIVRSGSVPAGGGASAANLGAYLPSCGATLAVGFPEECLRHVARFGGAVAENVWKGILAANPKRLEFLDAVEGTSCGNGVNCGCLPPASHILSSIPEGAEDSFGELTRQLTVSQIEQWLAMDCQVVLAGSCEGDLSHIEEWISKAKLSGRKGLQTALARLPGGLYIPEAKLAILTERELFSSPRRLRAVSKAPLERTRKTAELDNPLTGTEEASFLADLDVGDMAVHASFGICIYRGLKTMETVGELQEYIELEFADDAIVHIPVWQAHNIARYVGAKKDSVALSKMGSNRWAKLKEAATRSAKSVAMDMLRVQAVRSASEGIPFPKDELPQRLFEDSFPFEETADQRRSSEEIKRDMEASKPMDRLLCGDVGYGKTEVAMRAAFKCVSSGRQVAVLVPTTILAQQHYYSFLERFAEQPVTIDTLSRFKTHQEQKAIIAKLRSGGIDILIGTHRLLQGDVTFKELGLVIIDEEQRFGVVHKERLKSLRAIVDVLTMTATPIPRTLYMSMAGVRDLSTIMNAPVQRLPVQTIVAQHDEALIATAIQREMQRGGQVFFLHNRVNTIENEAKRLAAIVPEARIGIAHGQMDEHELEAVMSKFLEGSIDVLACTTIIESGLDIPNANTIIIDRADRFGLAELYQLRGRVGRWNRQAYSYLLLPKSGILTGDARRRISAIRRYTHLGAGFKLALRDLEIRGAGNILGAEQSGHISAIGFDLYCQMLRAVVSQLKGEKEPPRPEVNLNLDFLSFALKTDKEKAAASFPLTYINSERLRLEAYRRAASLSTQEALEAFEKELSDRFGALPRPAKNMLLASRIRAAAAEAGIDSVSVKEAKVMLQRNGEICRMKSGAFLSIDRTLKPEKRLASLLRIVLTVRDSILGNEA